MIAENTLQQNCCCEIRAILFSSHIKRWKKTVTVNSIMASFHSIYLHFVEFIHLDHTAELHLSPYFRAHSYIFSIKKIVDILCFVTLSHFGRCSSGKWNKITPPNSHEWLRTEYNLPHITRYGFTHRIFCRRKLENILFC